MEEDLVSIIIPTYNRADLIKETIKTVLNQSYQNFELLIVDDGSTDNTKEIVLSIKDDRINYIWQENSKLPAVPRNTGLKLARGEYIAFLDSDDLWFPQKIYIQMEVLKKNPDIMLVSTDGLIFSRNFLDKFLSIRKNKVISFRELLKNNIIINSSILMKKSVVDAIGFLDEDTLLRSMEDYDYWLRLLKYKENSILILKDILIKYRLHKSNIFEELDFIQKYKKWVIIFNKHKEFDSKFINSLLKKRLLQYRLMKMERNLFLRKISIYSFLKDKYVKFNEKIMVFLRYCFTKYKIDEKSILLNKISQFYLFRLIKALKR